MAMKRREFFRRSTALVGGVVVGAGLTEKAEAKPKSEIVPDFTSLVPDLGVAHPQPLSFEEKLMGMPFQPEAPRHFFDHPNWQKVRKSALQQISISAEQRRVHILDEDGLMATTVYSAVLEWADELLNMDEPVPVRATLPNMFHWLEGWRIQEGHENRFRYGSFFTDDEEWVQLVLLGAVDENTTILYQVNDEPAQKMPYTGIQEHRVRVPKDEKSVIRVWIDLPEEIRHAQAGHYFKLSEARRGNLVVPLHWSASGVASHLSMEHSFPGGVWQEMREDNEKRWREFWA
jgi:hypothetical protein